MNIMEFQHKLFKAAADFGFSDMEIYYEREEKTGFQFYLGDIDNYESSEVAGVSFRGVLAGRMGYAFTEKVAEDSIPFLLTSAQENALVIEDDEPEEIFSGDNHYRDGDFYSRALQELSTDQQIELLKDIYAHVMATDERVTGTDYLSFSTCERERTIFNSKGLHLSDRQNYVTLYLSVMAKSGDEVRTGTSMKMTKNLVSLQPGVVAKEAVQEAVSQLDGKSIQNRAYPVLFRSDMAALLLQTFSPVFSAENVQRGQSLLKDKVGAAIGARGLHIVDDPFLAEGISSRTFDGEGFPTKRLQVVEDGVLLSLLHNRKTAKKDNTDSTGHAYKASYKGAVTVSPSNFYVVPADNTYEELTASMHEGIIITGLSGLHSGANTISGDFSLAARGYYVKNGAVECAVNQMTIAGNFFDLLQSIEEIGSDLTWSPPAWATGSIGSPSLLVKELHVTVD